MCIRDREVGEGHGKATAGAAAALRNAFKEHGRHLGSALEARVHAALGAAGELEGWQRWRADQLREELVAKAEALIARKPKAKVKVRTRPAKPVAMDATAVADVPAVAGDVSPAPSTEPVAVETPAETLAQTPVEAPAEAPAAAAAEALEVNPAAPEAEAPVAAPEPAAQAPAPTEPAPDESAAAESVAKPTLGGRKMQETLRQLREQWKATDQGLSLIHI